MKKALTAASAPATVADDGGYNETHDLSARTVSLIFVLRMPTADPEITPELVEKHGLTPEEFERIKKILGREPNFTELGIFSVMWSEHCSYKNSRRELKKFPTTGPNILVKAGEENAGVVDIGDGWAIAFKIEIAQSSERGRTVPGRSHRSRRNHSRYFHHGRAAGISA